MNRMLTIVAAVLLPALLVACYDSGDDGAPMKISAIELHKAFMTDAKAAEKRLEGRTLLVTGEVGIAKARFTGRTAAKEVEVPAQVYLKTGVEGPASDVKYVICESDFDIPQASGGYALDPRIVVGQPLTVECSPAKIHWSSPGLSLFNCRIAKP